MAKSGKAQIPLDREGETLVRGKGSFTDDFAPRDALRAAFLRSPFAHGTITRLDTAVAAAAPGVVAVITAKDLEAAGCGPMTFAAPLAQLDGTPVECGHTPRPLLAGDRVRHVGEAVAMVVAESLGAAQDAVDLIEFDVEQLPVQLSLAETGPIDRPVWDFAPDNRSFEWSAGDQAAVEAALAEAAHVVSISLRNQRMAANPMENRAAVARYDADSGSYTVWCSTQGTTALRQSMAGPLGVEMDKLRVISGHVGGGFGVRAFAYPEYVAVAAASRITGRTIHWTSTRAETLLVDQHGRASEISVTGGYDEGGKLKALKLDIRSDLGAYITGVATAVQSAMLAECVAGPYQTEAISVRTVGVLTNSGPVGPYRGSGRPEAALALERMMDRAARQIGIDRLELRRRNLIAREQMPYTGPLGITYDSGNFLAVFDKALEVADWAGFEARRAASAERGLLRGIGCSVFLETAGPFPQEPLVFAVTEDGRVEIRTAAVSNGQRQASTLAHVVSQRLGVASEAVDVIAGDSAQVPEGPPSVGSRTAMLTGSAAAQAADEAIERGRTIVSALHEGRYNDISYENGVYTVTATGETIAFLEIPARLAALAASGREVSERLDGVTVFTSPGYTYPNGCHICEVVVDPETGRIEIDSFVAVDDSGTVLNPPVVEGQVIGGMAQGLGQAMMEELIYDAEGQLLTGTFMDYAMPRAEDLPRKIVIEDLPDPTPTNPLGVKGVGEAGTTGSLAAIMNAAENALEAVGVTDLQMPLTANRVWEAMQAAANP